MNAATPHAAATRAANLGLSIEARTRLKLVTAAKRAVSALGTMGARAEAIAEVNAERPIVRARAIGYEGPGEDMLQASSVLTAAGKDDAAWHKGLAEMERARNAYLRTILKLEAVIHAESAARPE